MGGASGVAPAAHSGDAFKHGAERHTVCIDAWCRQTSSVRIKDAGQSAECFDGCFALLLVVSSSGEGHHEVVAHEVPLVGLPRGDIAVVG